MPRRSKQDTERLLADVVEEHVFKCCNGNILRNMRELAESFATMTDETFAFHSNTERNDFSSWVRDIIRDEKLARDLEKSLSRTQAARSVTRRITFLCGKLA